MKRLLILSFATCHAVLNGMESTVSRPAFPTTPKGCFDIPSNQFLSNPTLQSRQAQRVMHALNLYYSLKAAQQTSLRQKAAIENILAAWQLYLNKHRTDYPELSSYRPEISHYKPETDLTKVRKAANTALWSALGKDYHQRQTTDHLSCLQIKSAINEFDTAANPNSLSSQSRKVKDLKEIRNNMQSLGTTQKTLPQMLFETSQSASSVLPTLSSSSSGTTTALSSSSPDSKKRSSDSDLIDAKRQKNSQDESGGNL